MEDSPPDKDGEVEPAVGIWVFVGVRADSGELWVATEAGLQVVRSVRRIPLEERWGAANKDMVRHVPWNRSGDDPEADGELPEEVAAPALGGEAAGGGDPARVIVVNTRETAPKEFYIKKRDVETHGVTKDCAGCRTMFHGGTRQNHSVECRERFRELLKGEGRVRRMQEKRKEFEEKAAEEEQRRLEKKKKKDEKKAEKRGRKRAAEDEADDEERVMREAPAEGENGIVSRRRGERKGKRRKATTAATQVRAAMAATAEEWRLGR